MDADHFDAIALGEFEQISNASRWHQPRCSPGARHQGDVRSFGIMAVLLHHRRQWRPTPAGPVVGQQPFTLKKVPRPILPPNVDG